MMQRERKSTGIMMASQVCERFVMPTRPKLDGTNRHHSEVSNYFARPPAPTTTTTRYTVHEAHAGTQAFTTETPSVAAPPPPPMAPLPSQAPAPAPVAFEPEPEPEPEKIFVAPETIVSWGTWSRAELYQQATELGIKGRSKMTKRMLLKALVAYVCE